VPPLEGKRVLVRVEPAEDSEATLTADVQARLWRAWAEIGPQGPIEGGRACVSAFVLGQNGTAHFQAVAVGPSAEIVLQKQVY
jgi:hypothetical protein